MKVIACSRTRRQLKAHNGDSLAQGGGLVNLWGGATMPREMNTRRWLLLILAASFVWLVATRANEMENLADTLAGGIWQWILVALLLQIGYFVTQARIYQVCFRLVGIEARLRALVPVFLGSMFINAVAPSGGTAGLALYVDEAVQRGYSGARAAAGTVLGVVGDYAGFALLLIYGLIYLQLEASVKIYEIIAAATLLLFTLVLASLLFLGATHPDALHRLLSRFQTLVNRIAGRLRRPPLLEENWSTATGSEFTAAAEVARKNPSGLLTIVGWSGISHLINAASLYTVFLAFGDQAPLAAVLAAFAIGHLFVIIAPSPQGVGFVETVVPLTLIRLGVSSAVATIVVLAFRGLAFWLPMLAGFFMLQRLRSLGSKERALRERWNVRIVAILTALMGLVNIVSVTYPELAQDLRRVTQFAPLQLRRGGQLGALLTGLVLLVLANALWRRKRAAWLITLVVLLLSAFSLTLNNTLLDFRTLLTLALAAWLVRLRPHFHARSDPPSVREGAVVILGAFAFLLIYGGAGLYVLARRSGEAYDLQTVLLQTANMIFALRPPAWLLELDSGRFVAISIYAIGALTLTYAIFQLLRPVLLRRPATAAERARAAVLVTTYGRNAMSRLAMQPNAYYYFSPGGSVVAFLLTGRTAVALGDPIGPQADIVEAVAGFADHCRRNDWLPSFYQATAAYQEFYEIAGFDSMAVGREAIVDLQEFDLNNGKQDVLQEVGRLLLRGYRAGTRMPPHPPELVEELQLINDEWLTIVRGGNSELVLSHFDATHVAQSPIVMTRTPRSLVSAYATLIVDPSGEFLAVDVLRHRPQIREGTLELLILTILQWAQRRGFQYVNLGAGYPGMADVAALDGMSRTLTEQDGNPDGEPQMMARLHEVRSRFGARWMPRYLVYPGATSLPAVWTAVARTSQGDNWLWSFLRRRVSL